MPKLTSTPPKFAKVKTATGKIYAAVYFHGKRFYLGAYGSNEAQTAYARFIP